MFPHISFRTKLFFIYSLIVAALCAVIFGAFYWRDYHIARRSLLSALHTDVERATGQLDSLLFTADLLATQLKSNGDIAGAMYLSTFAERPASYFRDHPALASRLQETMSSIVGIDVLSYYRIALINRNGALLSIGAYASPLQVKEKLADTAWFSRLDGTIAHGNRLLLPPHADNWGENGLEVISLIRKIDSNGYVHSLAEIQIPAAQLARIEPANDPSFREGGKQLWIFDGDGRQVWPTPLAAEDRDRRMAEAFYGEIRATSGSAFTKEASLDRRYMLAVHRSGNSEWTVVVSEPTDVLTKPIRETGTIFLIIAVLVILISLATIYVSTKIALRPLTELSRIMVDLPLRPHKAEGLFSHLDAQSTHNEVLHLYRSFRKMLDRLETSKEEAVRASSRELHARFVALQAQINPHFLYNTLSLVGMMGRETGNPRILRICTKLVDMLRYVTYAEESKVTIRQEVEHTRNYLDIMQMRYEDHLQCRIEMEETLMETEIPKLTLQPFVENALKHAFVRKRYPWSLSLRGETDDRGWRLTVSDDGSGFPASFLARWEERMRQSREGMQRDVQAGTAFASAGGPADVGEPRTEGSGLANLYERLRIAYGERLDFSLRNLPGGGAEVSIAVSGQTADKEGSQ